MSFDTEFITDSAPPALIAISDPELLAQGRAMLTKCGYKVRAASNHEDFISRISRSRYEIVIIEENFVCDSLEENEALRYFQRMAMPERRNTTVIILGESFQTLNPFQAFQQSVHAVLNPAEFESLGPVAQQAATNNGLFNEAFLAAEKRVIHY